MLGVVELEVTGKKHVGIGAENPGLGNHGKALGVVLILTETGQEIVHGSDNGIGSLIANHRVTIVGATGRIFTAHGEPVVVVVGCGSVGTLKVVAEEHHQHEATFHK